MGNSEDQYHLACIDYLTNHAIVTHAVSPQSNFASGQGLAQLTWIPTPFDTISQEIHDAFLCNTIQLF